MSELDPRKQAILHAIIIEYVTNAEPIGSEMLVQRHGLGVKSATVRNEMAEMSELGYLEQPHTSAGRIPSDLGYRYYVDRLIVTREVEDSAKQRLSDAANAGDALQALLRDTIRALSRATQLMGVATTLKNSNVVVKAALVSALGPAQALLVVVLSNGHVENRMVECPTGLTLEDIGTANEFLRSSFVGQNLNSLSQVAIPTGVGNSAVEKLVVALWNTIRVITRDLTRGVLITEGEEYMFGQPEFQRDAAQLAEMLHRLAASGIFYETLAPDDQSRPVTIGKEHRHEQMHPLSVVRQSFYVGDDVAGVIALVGPTRMPYDISIPLVGYTAKALSESLTRFFG